MPTKLTPELEKEFRPKFNKLKTILTGIHTKSQKYPEEVFNDLYSILSNPIIHIQALGNISPNKGMSTPGIDNQTLSGMNMTLINNIALEFKNKTFQFKPFKRVYIPKPGTKKLRPLGIPTIKDRIVQESIRMILEAIYEPKFESLYFQNYGFRPNKSCHKAIEFL